MGFRKTATGITVGLPDKGSPVSVLIEPASEVSLDVLEQKTREAGGSEIVRVGQSMLSAKLPAQNIQQLSQIALVHRKAIKQVR